MAPLHPFEAHFYEIMAAKPPFRTPPLKCPHISASHSPENLKSASQSRKNRSEHLYLGNASLFIKILFTIFVPMNPPPPNQQNEGFPLEFLSEGPQTELRTLGQNCEQTLQKLRTNRIMNKRAFPIIIASSNWNLHQIWRNILESWFWHQTLQELHQHSAKSMFTFTSGKKKQHKHKLFGPDFPRTFLTLTPGWPGVKKFLPITGAAETRTFWCGRPRFLARTSMTRRGFEKLCTKKFALIFWPLSPPFAAWPAFWTQPWLALGWPSWRCPRSCDTSTSNSFAPFWCNLSGPVLRDTARLSQRYPPIARYGVFGVSTQRTLTY